MIQIQFLVAYFWENNLKVDMSAEEMKKNDWEGRKIYVTVKYI